MAASNDVRSPGPVVGDIEALEAVPKVYEVELFDQVDRRVRGRRTTENEGGTGPFTQPAQRPGPLRVHGLDVERLVNNEHRAPWLGSHEGAQILLHGHGRLEVGDDDLGVLPQQEALSLDGSGQDGDPVQIPPEPLDVLRPFTDHALGRDDDYPVDFVALGQQVEGIDQRDGLTGTLFVEDTETGRTRYRHRGDVDHLVVIENVETATVVDETTREGHPLLLDLGCGGMDSSMT